MKQTDLFEEIIVDNFAGGGGASTGIELAAGSLASYCQESTRYCNYSKDRFGSEITVIEPFYLTQGTPGYS